MDEKSLGELSGEHSHEESPTEPLPYTRPEVDGDIREQRKRRDHDIGIERLF